MFILDRPITIVEELFVDMDYTGLGNIHNYYCLNDIIGIGLPLPQEHNLEGNDKFTFVYNDTVKILGKDFPCIHVGDYLDSLPFFSEETMQRIKEHIESSADNDFFDKAVWDPSEGLFVEDEIIN